MELLLLLVGAAIGLVSSLVTTALNNRFERERLHEAWHRQVCERKAEARRQRMERVLDPVRAHVSRVVRMYSATEPSGAREHIPNADRLANISEITWEHVPAIAAAAVVGDETLEKELSSFLRKVDDAGIKVACKADWDEECAQLRTQVIESSAVVLRRCDELLEEEYAEAILNA